MEFFQTLLEQQPMLALFFTIAVGYLVGEINIKGFSLGVGAVLFVAIAVGWFAPKAAPAPMIGTLGLALFLYTVGVQYGKQFFVGLTSRDGVRANVMAVCGVLLAGLVCISFVKWFGISEGIAYGLFAGSGTSTATLQAALTAIGNKDPAVGYSVSYPFGVAGPILFLYVVYLVMKPKFETTSTGLELHEIQVLNPEFVGKTVGESMQALPVGIQIVALRRAHRNQPAYANSVIEEDDVLLTVAPNKEVLALAAETIGRAAQGRFSKDRSDLDYLRVFASKPTAVGRPLADLELPGGKDTVVLHVRRGDADILPTPDLILEFGDRVGLLSNRAAHFPALRRFFGDSIKGTAEVSYISVGLGMALGFALGAITIPLPGIGKLAIGIIGVLLVALVLGKIGRTGGINWTMPLSANKVLFNLGLTLFLANAGMSSGTAVVETVAQTGFLMLGLGAIVLVALVLPVLILGFLVFKMPYDQVAGIFAGTTGNPAILAYGNKLAPTDRPDVGYAMIFPSMTILKILFVNVAAVLV